MKSNPAKWLVMMSCGMILSACVIDLKKQAPAVEADVEDVEVETDDVDSTDNTDSTDATTQVEVCPGACDQCRRQGACAELPSPELIDTETCECDCKYSDDYVPEEGTAHCNGIDDDCDGVVDDNIVDNKDKNCVKQGGVCDAGVKSICLDGAMVCFYDEVENYEQFETLCDGLDNDCDGDTDEVYGSPMEICDPEKTDFQIVGECATTIVSCEDGEWKCDPQGKFQKGAETSCDGLDNDCDGEIDDGVSKLGSPCKKKGACASFKDEIPKCVGGQWMCDYSQVTGYEGKIDDSDEFTADKELSCDNIDNDCDGETDEDVIADEANCTDQDKQKQNKGVCQGKVQAFCAAGGITICEFGANPDYEPIEISCDNKDNDCNGLTDEELTEPPVGTCSKLGECALGAEATCLDGAWQCKFGSDAWEENELTCDGKDNDCDGKIDEDVIVSPEDCADFGVGVCKSAAGVTATCDSIEGKPICNYDNVTNYQKTETLCDKLDNDCDGEVDAELFDFANSTCKKMGVCAASHKKVKAKCGTGPVTATLGTWECDYSDVPDYEGKKNYVDTTPDVEVTCDGLDNDCDGIIDEDILDATGGDCPTQGVCGDPEHPVQATCSNGSWLCDFSKVLDYQYPEILCDGKDNNCDGVTDEGSCGTLSPCEGPIQCVSNICKEAPDHEALYCVEFDTLCPNQDGTEQVDANTTECALIQTGDGSYKWFESTCEVKSVDGVQFADWVEADEPCQSNACVNGKCALCVPGTTFCKGGTTIEACNAQGNPFTLGTCTLPATCIVGGQGLCLEHIDHDAGENFGYVSDTEPAIAARGDGSECIVTWSTLKPDEGEFGRVVARRTNETAKFNLKTYGVLDPFKNAVNPLQENQSGSAVTYVKDDVVASAWVESAGEDSSVIQLMGLNVQADKGFYKSLTTANSESQFLRRNVRIVNRGTAKEGVTLVWETQTAPNGKGRDIVTRSYDLGYDGQTDSYIFISKSESEIFVNDKPSKDETNPNQENPALIRLQNNDFVVAWQDTLANESLGGIYARKLDAQGNPTGATVQLNSSVEGVQSNVSLAALPSGGFVAAWQSSHTDAGDIMVGSYDSNMVPKTNLQEVFLTGATMSGTQHSPSIAAFSEDRVIVAWVDDDKENEGQNIAAGSGVYMLQLSGTLSPQGLVKHVNLTTILGDQNAPTVVNAGTAESPWALIAYVDTVCHVDPDNASASLPCVYTRPFEIQPAICIPQCQGKECGSDGCGATCGECAVGLTCNDDNGTCEDE